MSLISKLAGLPVAVKQYLVITGNYWAFTLTDGALRMLVVLYFHQLGYTPIAIAMLFLFYEFFGVVTNLIGGWLGARIGLNKTMHIGLYMQVVALAMLTLPSEYLTVAWVMLAQALSGIAKDLNKMSAKSSIKTLVPKEQQSSLFRWVALLTGSKNTLKGVGFFIGAMLLAVLGFQFSLIAMASALLVVALLSSVLLKQDIGKAKNKPKFKEIFSKNAALNYLSAARMFLFAARDVWFVIAVPVYLSQQLGWQHEFVGGFMAVWIIGYGIVQSITPKMLLVAKQKTSASSIANWAIVLAVFTAILSVSQYYFADVSAIVVLGLLIFGVVFAINSSLHSYAIIALAKEDGVSMDVGFYYMANALGRLFGTILSGWLFQVYGLAACLLIAAILAACSAFFIRKVNI
ncbi:organoarsenical effux MFS transporter ArsJ [Colwelliaceae bacterium 6471]